MATNELLAVKFSIIKKNGESLDSSEFERPIDDNVLNFITKIMPQFGIPWTDIKSIKYTVNGITKEAPVKINVQNDTSEVTRKITVSQQPVNPPQIDRSEVITQSELDLATKMITDGEGDDNISESVLDSQVIPSTSKRSSLTKLGQASTQNENYNPQPTTTKIIPMNKSNFVAPGSPLVNIPSNSISLQRSPQKQHCHNPQTNTNCTIREECSPFKIQHNGKLLLFPDQEQICFNVRYGFKLYFNVKNNFWSPAFFVEIS